MVSSRTPGVNNITPANNAADNEANEVSSSPDAVDAGVGLGEDDSRVNGVPGNNSDGGVCRGGNGDGDSDRGGRGDDGANVGWSQSGPPSLSMSVDLHNLVTSTNHQDSGRYSVSPDHAGSATPAAAVVKIGCYDEEESYEAFGSVEGDADDGPDSPGGSSSAPSPTGTSRRNPRSPNSTVGRHSWLRTSLRRTPPCSGRKRLSSNALASQLYRSGSFNSSGMGSNYDPADDVYSDVSLEDVMDLSHKTATTTTNTRDTAQNGSTKFPERAPVKSAGIRDEQWKSEDYRLLRDVSDEQPPSFPSDIVMETFASTVYGDEDKDDDTVESNDDATTRDIEYQPMRKLDIAVGTGTCILKYDRYDT